MGLDLVFDGEVALLEFDHGKANEMGSAQLEAFASLGETLREKGTLRQYKGFPYLSAWRRFFVPGGGTCPRPRPRERRG